VGVPKYSDKFEEEMVQRMKGSGAMSTARLSKECAPPDQAAGTKDETPPTSSSMGEWGLRRRATLHDARQHEPIHPFPV
jgi:hypothetical protein